MDEPLVEVEVVVNVDSMRRGQVGQVELSPRIQALIDRGYLKLLGHVHVPAVEVFPVALEAPEPPTPTKTPAKRVRPSRAKPDATAIPPEAMAPVQEVDSGNSPGDAHLE